MKWAKIHVTHDWTVAGKGDVMHGPHLQYRSGQDFQVGLVLGNSSA